MAVDAGQIQITAEARTEQAEASLKQLQQALRNTSKELSATQSNLTSLLPGGNAASEVFSRLRGGLYQLIQGLSASAFRGVSDTFSAIVKNGKETATALESANVAFTTFLKSEEDALRLSNKIARDAVKTPFDVSGLAQATQKLVMITRDGALAEETIVNLGKAVTAAGGGDEQLARISTYLQQIGINGKITQRQLNAFGTAGVNILQMVYDKFGEVYGFTLEGTKEWLQNLANPFEAVTQAINAAGREGGEFADVYDRMSGTISQLNANLNDSIGIFGKIVGEQSGIIEKYKDILKELVNQFSDPTVIGTFAESVRKLTQNFDGAKIIQGFFNNITKVLAAFNSGEFNNVIVFFKTLFDTLKNFYGVSMVGSILKFILSMFSDQTPARNVAILAKAIGVLINTVLSLKVMVAAQKWGANLASVIVQLMSTVRQATFSFSGLVGTVFSSIGFIIMIVNTIQSLGSIFEDTSSTVDSTNQKTSNSFKSTSNTIQKSMQDAADGVGQSGQDMAKHMQDVYTELAKLQAEWVSEMHQLGAFDYVEQIEQYRYFASLYASGTKARLALDEKVHDAEISLSKEIISLTEEFNKKFNEAYKSAKDYYDMFEYTQVVLTRTTASVIEGLQRQNDNMTKYYENLRKMSQMGFNEDFMTYVYEAGMDAATEVAGLANATEEQIEEINRLWETRGKVATDIAVLNTKKLKDETLQEISYLQTGLQTQVVDVYDTGTLLMSSFTEGIRDYMPTLDDAMRNVAANLSDTLSSGFELPISDIEAELGNLGDSFEGLYDRINPEKFGLGNLLLALLPVVGGAIQGLISGSKEKLKDIEKATRDTTDEIKGTIKASVSEILEDIKYAIYQCSNWDRVYRQAVSDGTDETTQNLARMLDVASANQIVTTQQAIQAMSDIMMNGMDDLGASTQEILDKAASGMENGLYKVAYATEDAYETVNEKTTRLIDQNIKQVGEAGEEMVKNAEKTMEKSSGKIATFFSNIGQKATSALKGVGGLVSKIFPEAGKTIEGVADAIDGVVTPIEQVKSTVSGLGDSFKSLPLFNNYQESLVEIPKKTEQIVTETNSKLSQIGGGGVVDNLKNTMAESMDKVKESATTGMDSVAQATQQSAEKVSQGFTGPLSKAAEWCQGAFANITSIIKGFMDIIFDTIDHVITKILGIINNAVGGIMKILQTAFGGIGKALQALLEPLSNPTLLLGVAALAGIAASIGILALAMKQFNDVGWDSLGKAAVAIAEMGVIAAGLSFASPFILAGAAAITAMGVSIAAFGAGLIVVAEALDKIGDIQKAVNFDAIEGAVSAIKEINNGFDIKNTYNLRNTRLVASISVSIMSAVNAVKSITDNLLSVNIKEDAIQKKLTEILNIVNQIASLDFGNAWDKMFKVAAAKQVAKISEVVVEILDQVISMVDKLEVAKSKLPANSKDTVDSVVGKCIDIVVKLAEFKDENGHSLNTDKEDWFSAAYSGLSGAVGNIQKISGKVNEIMDSIVGMVTKLQGLSNKGLNGQQIDSYISQAISYVTKIGEFKSSTDNTTLKGRLEGVNNNLVSMANNAGNLASNVKRVVEGIVDAIFILKKLEDAGIKDIDSYITNINTYVGDLSKIKIEQNVEETAKKAEQVANLTSSVKNIFTNLIGLMQEFDNFNKDYGNRLILLKGDPNNEADYITRINKIIEGVAKIDAGDTTAEAIKNTSETVSTLSTLTGNVKDIITNITDIIKVITEKASILEENALKSKIDIINKALAIIGGGSVGDVTYDGIKANDIAINADTVTNLDNLSKAVDHIATISNKIGDVKDVANKQGAVENVINFVKNVLSQIPATLQSYGEDYFNQGDYYASRFIAGWNKNNDNFINLGEELGASILAGVGNKYQDLDAAGMSAQTHFISGVERYYTSDTNAGKNMISKVINGINKNIATLFVSGGTVATSFANGIRNKLGDIEEAGKAMANALTRGYNNAIKPLSVSVESAKAWSAQNSGSNAGKSVNIIQNNNIYNEMDLNAALNSLSWSVSRE